MIYNIKPAKIPKLTILNDRESNDSNSESQLDELISESNLSSSSDDSESDSNESDSDDSESESNTSDLVKLENSNDDILKNFDYNISSVLNGKFFNLYPDKYNMNTIKCKYSIKTIETLNEKLESLRSQYLINDAEIDNILRIINLPVQEEQENNDDQENQDQENNDDQENQENNEEVQENNGERRNNSLFNINMMNQMFINSMMRDIQARSEEDDLQEAILRSIEDS